MTPPTVHTFLDAMWEGVGIPPRVVMTDGSIWLLNVARRDSNGLPESGAWKQIAPPVPVGPCSENEIARIQIAAYRKVIDLLKGDHSPQAGKLRATIAEAAAVVEARS